MVFIWSGFTWLSYSGRLVNRVLLNTETHREFSAELASALKNEGIYIQVSHGQYHYFEIETEKFNGELFIYLKGNMYELFPNTNLSAFITMREFNEYSKFLRNGEN